MNDGTEINPLEADPAREQWLDFWLERGKEMVSKSLGVGEESARQLVAVYGVLTGLYFNAVAFSDLHKGLYELPAEVRPGLVFVFLLPFAFMVAGLLACLLIFFPDRTKWDFRSSAGAEAIYTKAVRSNLWMLRASLVCLVLTILSIGLGMVVYLLWIPLPPKG